MNKRILFMGTPAFAVASLNALIAAKLDVAAVVTAPDRPAGRGQQLRMSAVKLRALELGLPILQPERLKDPEFHAQLDKLDASLYVVVAFRMLPATVWGKPRRGTVNLHASLLPNYRGAAPINWAVMNGELRTGLTTFFINDTIDTGDILLREVVEIGPAENAGALHDRMMIIGGELLVHTVKNILDDSIEPIPQAEFVGDNAHDAPKLTPENCRIDWTQPAQRVHDHIRGLSPIPGAWTLWKEEGRADRQFKILAATPVPGLKHGTAGSVTIKADRLLVHCGTGAIEALEVQMQGKRPMDSASFLRGLQRRSSITLG
ncbi:MAG: methionyl-tRNA formyltransferase [Flavobacteriales bacterium]|jgi:methionyl-tRNA formyltransferase|nr:methionyl-tRNA formyltransferase [Flavobacteriales bacterium]MCB0759647.1 methionyl-tRNA formyltransferase [Flavobacteriales bacterium]